MKNIRHITIIAITLAAIFTVPACKSEVGESVYVITPLREKEPAEEGGEDVYDIPQQVTAHIFMDVEGTKWKPLSYEDAVQGVLSDTISEVHMTLNANATFQQREDGSLLLGSLQGERRHYLVVYDKEDEIYAWRELKPAADAGTIYLSIYFRPWRNPKTPTTTYTETGWTILNKYVAPEPEPDPDPGPEDEEGEGEDEDEGEEGAE